jgi:hypothetical protein
VAASTSFCGVLACAFRSRRSPTPSTVSETGANVKRGHDGIALTFTFVIRGRRMISSAMSCLTMSPHSHWAREGAERISPDRRLRSRPRPCDSQRIVPQPLPQ